MRREEKEMTKGEEEGDEDKEGAEEYEEDREQEEEEDGGNDRLRAQLPRQVRELYEFLPRSRLAGDSV